MIAIETYVKDRGYEDAIIESNRLGCDSFSQLLSIVTKKKIITYNTNTNTNPKIKVKILCSWTTSYEIREYFNKMSKGDYTWGNIQLVIENPDFYVIINGVSGNEYFDPTKSIVFQMEPNMSKNSSWGQWSNPDPTKFFKVFTHSVDYNNLEWHLSKTYTELSTMKIEKLSENDSIISTVLSAKYTDIGHIKRIDFVHFMEKKGQIVHVYGDNKWNYKSYKGSLPMHQKDNGLFPYKYTFTCENHFIKNYFTEKLVDAILSECLCFYGGCYNVREFIDERAFVYLELSNFQKDYEIIQTAIREDWYSQRIDVIRKEKQKILNQLQFFPRLEKILTNNEKKDSKDEIE